MAVLWCIFEICKYDISLLWLLFNPLPSPTPPLSLSQWEARHHLFSCSEHYSRLQHLLGRTKKKFTVTVLFSFAEASGFHFHRKKIDFLLKCQHKGVDWFILILTKIWCSHTSHQKVIVLLSQKTVHHNSVQTRSAQHMLMWWNISKLIILFKCNTNGEQITLTVFVHNVSGCYVLWMLLYYEFSGTFFRWNVITGIKYIVMKMYCCKDCSVQYPIHIHPNHHIMFCMICILIVAPV